ncbi:hypothetical protein I6N96_18950 [Enterococcus sp. BWM-S5]|uniref:Uncharacterized protein n=1 Tax=Enterococcus larvae TaxID=2794352 RepID=A0ABS4CP74_9ENTE|nr:hypothetical protein [Enterococcus larvae]MBP1048376.1 hypothetical protein [Enterococcus larvae]
MEQIYMYASFISFFGAFLLVVGFSKQFKELTLLQKSAIILVFIGTLVPIIVGTIQGFLSA